MVPGYMIRIKNTPYSPFPRMSYYSNYTSFYAIKTAGSGYGAEVYFKFARK